MKQTIKLRESELKRMIAESVNKILNEVEFNGQSYHGNRPYDWSRMAQLRHELSVNAKRDAGDEQRAYEYSFDPRDREHYYDYMNTAKKHEKNRDKNWKNYQELSKVVKESIKRMLSESDEGMKQFIKMHKSSKAGLPMSKLFHISKTFNGDPNRSYVIWFGERIVDTAENYEEAVAKCKEIYNSI